MCGSHDCLHTILWQRLRWPSGYLRGWLGEWLTPREAQTGSDRPRHVQRGLQSP